MTRTDNAQRDHPYRERPPGTLVSDLRDLLASVTASSPGSNDTKLFTISVTAAANNPPTLAQPANMTVNEVRRQIRRFTATDPDANPLSFSKNLRTGLHDG